MDIYSYQREMSENEIKLFYVKIEFRIINCYRRLEKIDALSNSDVYKNSPVMGFLEMNLFWIKKNTFQFWKEYMKDKGILKGI
mgnify:CR=1 FL=1